jgi:aspartate ammonia-lyase
MEINHFEPVIARALFNSIESLRQVTQLFRARCIEGLQVNVERSYENLATSTAISSLFLPVIGYKKVCELVRIADLEKRPFVDVVIQEGLINKGNLDELLRIAARPSST